MIFIISPDNKVPYAAPMKPQSLIKGILIRIFINILAIVIREVIPVFLAYTNCGCFPKKYEAYNNESTVTTSIDLW